jgi:hypothetical protein
MRIYVIERHASNTIVQLGWTKNKIIAEKKCKEYNIRGLNTWIQTYELDKDGFCEFDSER